MNEKNEKTAKQMQEERLTEGGGAFHFLSEEEVKKFEALFKEKYGKNERE